MLVVALAARKHTAAWSGHLSVPLKFRCVLETQMTAVGQMTDLFEFFSTNISGDMKQLAVVEGA